MVFTKNRELAQNIRILLLTIFVVLILALVVIARIEAHSLNDRIKDQFHPYLQLNPPETDTLNYQYGKRSVKIFCLGGSTTEFKDSKKAGWTERLEKELREIYKSDSIFVFNFGKQWYTTLHSLINYETNLRHHKPDIVLYMHNINDLLQNAEFSYFSNGVLRQDYGHFIGPLSDIIKTRSLGIFGRNWIRLKHFWYYDFPAKMTIELNSFPGIAPFTRNINTLIDLALLDSTKVILLTEPNILSESMDEQIRSKCKMVNFEAVGDNKKWGYLTAYIGMKQYNERIKEIAENRNVYCIDLEKHIPKSLAYFTDDVHYTDITFDIISKILAEEIVRLKIIQK